MATTTDTLIFELKVKDDASKTFDAWDKKLKDLEKQFEKFGDTVSKSMSDAFSGGNITSSLDAVGNMTDPFKKLVSNAGSIITSGFTSIFTGLIGIVSNVFTKILDIGIATFKKIGTETVEFVKSSITAFMSFEDQLSLVGKTTGMAGEELKAFGKEIIQLAKPIGSLKAEDLLKVAEAAGQLGIAKEDIAAFSVSIGIGSIALDKFGGSTEKLATSIAKQQNVFGDASSSTDSYLSMLSKLSTSTAANELQISNFNLGMAKTASAMGITAQESSALGSVLIAGGLDASKASRLLSSSLVDLSTKSKSLGAAVQIMQQDMANGGEGIAKLEEITGRSRESFASLAEMVKTSFGVDAVQSMLAVSGAFAGIDQSAQKTELAYDAVGKTGLAVLSLLGDAVNKNSDDVKSMAFVMETANAAFTSGSEHLEAYDRAMAKTSAQLDLFGSMMDSIKLVIGEVFVEAIGRLMLKVNDFMTVFSDWIAENETFKLVLNDVVAGLEAIANIALDTIIASFKEFIGYVDENGTTVWDTVKTKVLELWETVKGFFSDLMERIKSADPSTMAQMFDDVVAAIVAVGDAAASLWSIFKSLSDLAGGLKIGEAFKPLKPILEGIADILNGDVAEGLKLIGGALIDTAIDRVNALADTFKKVFLGIAKLGVEAMESIAGAVTDKIGGAVSKALDAVKGVGGSIKDAFTGSNDAVKDTGKAIDDMTASTKAAEDASKALANTNYGNSTYPDTTEWVNKTSSAITGMASKTNIAESASKALGSASVASLNQMATAYENLNQHVNRYNPPTTIANAGYSAPSIQDIASSGRQTDKQSTSKAAPAESRTSSIGHPTTTTVINFSGTNIVDESSKERFIRQITQAQSGLSRTSVRAA